MRTAQPALAFVLLVTIQCVCGLPGSQTPSPITPGGVTEAPQDDSVGTINLVVSQVQTGPTDNLQYLDGIQNFHNGDGVLVTEGGKGKLALNDGTQMTLFNETQISGVNVSTSPPRTDLFLQSQGFLGYVPPGGRTTVNMPNGAKITILGTRFFILSNNETKVTTAGNFDGTVLYTPPGGTEQQLPPGLMVNIPSEGEVELLEIPFTPERFEQAVDSAGTPTAGLNTLLREYQIEPLPGEPSKPSTASEVVRMTHDDAVWSVAFSPDGKYVVSGSADSTARVWEASTGKEVARMTYESGGWVSSVAFSLPDGGRYVVSGGWDRTVRVWEASTGKEVARITHDDSVISVAFSLPDGGRYVVSGGWDRTVRVWEASTGKEVARMSHDDVVNSVAFSPDGKYVVSGSEDGTVRMWEASTGSEVALMTHDSGVMSVAFSPDGRYVVSGGYDQTARVWEVSTGKEVARMTHDGSVNSVAFSPDGKYAVSSGSTDHTAHVWEVSTGREVARMVHDNVVYSVAFSPDGSYVVSGSADNTARIWMW